MDWNNKRYCPYSDETSGIGGKYRPTTYGVYDNLKNAIAILNIGSLEDAETKAIEMNTKYENKKLNRK